MREITIVLNKDYYDKNTITRNHLKTTLPIAIKVGWVELGAMIFPEEISDTKKKDSLGRTIYQYDSVKFVIRRKTGSVSSLGFFGLDRPETEFYQDQRNARALSYEARRHKAYAWLKNKT